MFGHAYFGAPYWGGAYWGPVSGASGPTIMSMPSLRGEDEVPELAAVEDTADLEGEV